MPLSWHHSIQCWSQRHLTTASFNGPIMLPLPCWEIKDALANTTLLVHPQPDAPINIMTDTSDIAIRAVFQQYLDSQWCPLSYFSRKLTLQSSTIVDFQVMAKAQPDITTLQSMQTTDNSFTFAKVSMPMCTEQLLCDTSTSTPRPFVPETFRHTVFNS